MLTYKIINDQYAESPREWDNLGTFTMFHGCYNFGDKHNFKTPSEVYAHIKRTKAISLPVYMYDHSGQTISTKPFSCPWDSGQIGEIFVTKEKILKEFNIKRLTKTVKDKVRQILIDEISVLDEYVKSEVYGFKIFDENDNEIESCYGFYGRDDAENEVKSVLAYHERVRNEKSQEKMES